MKAKENKDQGKSEMIDPITYNILDDPAYQEMFYFFQDPEILLKLDSKADGKQEMQKKESDLRERMKEDKHFVVKCLSQFYL